MYIQLTNSSNLTASLSREAFLLFKRCENILTSIVICNNKTLINRLEKELYQLEKRRSDIKDIAVEMKKNEMGEYLSLDYLLEVCSRQLT